MTSIDWARILAQATATGVVVVLASILAEAIGPFWGALLVSLPVASGPVYAFMALNHGRDFIAGAALNGFAATAATGLCRLGNARRAPGGALGRAFIPAVLAWLAAAVPIAAVAWMPPTATLLNMVVYGAGVALSRPTARHAETARGTATVRRWLALLLRAVAVALFAAAVLALGAALGPARTGVIAAFPVTLASTFVILHRQIGGVAAGQMASTAIRGVFGFGLTLLTLHLLVQPWGAGLALLAALLMSLAWSAGLLAVRHRAAPRAALR